MALSFFDTKRTREMREAIARMERAVEEKRAETESAECRLRKHIEDVTKGLERPPPAGALVWRGRGDG